MTSLMSRAMLAVAGVVVTVAIISFIGSFALWQEDALEERSALVEKIYGLHIQRDELKAELKLLREKVDQLMGANRALQETSDERQLSVLQLTTKIKRLKGQVSKHEKQMGDSRQRLQRTRENYRARIRQLERDRAILVQEVVEGRKRIGIPVDISDETIEALKAEMFNEENASSVIRRVIRDYQNPETIGSGQ